MRGAARSERPRDRLALGRRGSGEPLMKTLVVRIDPQLASALPVDQPEARPPASCCSRQSRISTAKEVVAAGEAEQRSVPIGGPRKSETTATKGIAARDPGKPSQHQCERRAEQALGRIVSQRAEHGEQAGAALARRVDGNLAVPEPARPARFPRTVAACASATVAPTATSIARRSAVPNAIEGEGQARST